MTHIAVTGGSGFVGGALLAKLVDLRFQVVAPARRMGENGIPEWELTNPVDVIVHTAARVHIMHETSKDPLWLFRQANVEGTIRLARQAAAIGVKRFVFVSSVKVNGEQSGRMPFSALDKPLPSDSYGISKLEAEIALFALAKETAMEIVIVRPPLVYGPGVKANFLQLMKLVKRGIPLPLASVYSKRSMVALDNLIDLLALCVVHPNAAGKIFMVSDDHDVSVAQLIIMLARAMRRPSRLFRFPVGLIKFGAATLGQSKKFDRLFGTLQVDITYTKSTLGWKPVIGIDDAIKKAASDFCRHQI